MNCKINEYYYEEHHKNIWQTNDEICLVCFLFVCLFFVVVVVWFVSISILVKILTKLYLGKTCV